MPPPLIRQVADRFLPFMAWRRPDQANLRRDLLAGLTVALLAIPQAMAYAQLAGAPAAYGLYAAFLPSIIGVLFGSSALLSTGPVALTSLLTAASVGHIATPGSTEYFAAVTLMALLSGLIQIGLGLARAGMMLSLLSHPVLVGFINAAAVVIALSQLPALTGIALPQAGNVLADTGNLLVHLNAIHLPSALMGLAALAMLVGFKRLVPKLPGVLIMVVLLTVVSWGVDFAKQGGQVVGAIPTGLPGLSMPRMDFTTGVALLPSALIIALVSFTEAMSSCKSIATKTQTRWDENQELVGQGLAKVAAAFSQSMPVSGSFSRSALNLASHAVSGWSSLFTAGFVLLTLLLLTPLLYHLPKPALAAMIVMAVANLIDLPAMRSAWRTSFDDGVAALLSFGATLVFAPNIQNGILAGILFALGAFIYRRMEPRMSMLGMGSDGTLADLEGDDVAPLDMRVAGFRFDAALFFANVSYFERTVLRAERQQPALRFVLVDASAINQLDASGVEMLRNLARHLRERHITLVWSGTKPQVFDVMVRSDLIDHLGLSNLHADEASAWRAIRTQLQAEDRAAQKAAPAADAAPAISSTA